MSAEPIETETARDEAYRAEQGVRQRRAVIERRLGLPPRPKKIKRETEMSWMGQAACATAPDADRLAFVEDGGTQSKAWSLVARYCAGCPVASACLADGRRTHLSGIAGGYVLVDGRLALDTTPANAFRSAAAWTPPWELDEVDGDDCLPDQVVRLLTLARDGVTAGQAGAAITDGDEPTEPLTELGRRALVALEEAG